MTGGRERTRGTNGAPPQAGEWRDRLLAAVTGLLVFETLTGLGILFLPFSVTNQVAVVLHTAVGVVFVAPFLWYQIRHWLKHRRDLLTHVKLTGYLAMVAAAVCVASGLVLTYQAVFATRISYGWDLAHIVSTFALIAAAAPHVLAKVVQNARVGDTSSGRALRAAERTLALRTTWIAGALVAGTFVLAGAYQAPEVAGDFPEDYGLPLGAERPFAPSLARTSTGGVFDSRATGGSASCGRAGCHQEIYREWQASAHRYSAMDTAFRVVQTVMAEQNSPESTRYCAGCHDPISLFAGAKRASPTDLTTPVGRDEGVSCIVCHAIDSTDVKGNASYVISLPERYMYELRDGAAANFVSDFLIRAYPQRHVESLSHRMFKSPEFCAACHKQFVDEEVNQVGWVQLQNQYDSWRKSRWNHPGEPTKTVECRECHMRLVESSDPASGDPLDYNRSPDDGKHRSHRFLAANQFMPLALGLEGAEKHVELVERWLQGRIEIPEIQDKWTEGPAVPLELEVPEVVRPGEQVEISATFTNNKAGHDFPTGPLDIIQSWVEITVTDRHGNVVFQTGDLEDGHFVEPGSFVFKADPVDERGEPINRHNLWELVGVRYARTLYPGFSDRAEFAFMCPGLSYPAADSTPGTPATPPADTTTSTSPRRERFAFRAPEAADGELRIHARLLYRKSNQQFLNFILGGDGSEASVTAPITVLDTARRTIPVVRSPASDDR